MALVLLIAGIFAVLAGLLAILFGIPVKEFSFGNTLILAGAGGVCSGALLIGLYAVLVELKNVGRRLAALAAPDVRVRQVFPPGIAPPGMPVPGTPPGEIKLEPPVSPPQASPAPWKDEAATRQRAEAPAQAGPSAEPPVPRRRNLLFASTSRRERERAEAKAAEGASSQPPDARSQQPGEAAPSDFEDAWPKPERGRPADQAPPWRPAPRSSEPAAPPAAPREGEPRPEQPPVTVLKSGIVDGMAYSLYSDGSIEAQMPEGMMRFASIDELRAHLDQRS